MTKIKVCDRCLKKIRPKVEDYYQVDTYEKGKLIKTGFLHKRCNEEMEKQKETVMKAFDMVGKATEKLGKMMGIEKEEVYEIKA